MLIIIKNSTGLVCGHLYLPVILVHFKDSILKQFKTFISFGFSGDSFNSGEFFFVFILLDPILSTSGLGFQFDAIVGASKGLRLQVNRLVSLKYFIYSCLVVIKRSTYHVTFNFRE